MEKHTWGVWWTAIFFILHSLVYVVAFFILTTITGIAYLLDMFPLTSALAGVSFVLILFAVAYILIVKGLFEHKQWAWLLALLIWGYNVLSNLLSLREGSIIGLAIGIIALYGLLNNKTTKLFKM